MRTLDEVIEIASDWTNGFDESSIEKQMLYYLKEYQERKEMLRYWNEKVISEQQNLVDTYMFYKIALEKEKNNPPLTWPKLRQMEGKPVWVEYNLHIGNKDFRDKSKRWCIVREFKPWHDTEIIITENGFVLSKNEQIKCWQAYRKERS